VTRIMIIVGSVRPRRVGLPIAKWVSAAADDLEDIEIDFVDLAELALPMMDEPNHPRLRQYTKQHTRDWSARVEAADGFIFVTPEYNHSLDFLAAEWWRKPVGVVSYGGVSAGTRGVVALEPVMAVLGLVRVGAAVEISLLDGLQIADGQFVPSEKESAILTKMFSELTSLAQSLKESQK
jgi:NAD(P)H-dependent FMN reductase